MTYQTRLQLHHIIYVKLLYMTSMYQGIRVGRQQGKRKRKGGESDEGERRFSRQTSQSRARAREQAFCKTRDAHHFYCHCLLLGAVSRLKLHSVDCLFLHCVLGFKGCFVFSLSYLFYLLVCLPTVVFLYYPHSDR